MPLADTKRWSKRLVLAGLLLAPGAAWADEVDVLGVRYWTLNDSTRVAIELSGDFHFVSSRIANPDRVFFDVAQSRPAIKGSTAGLHVVRVDDSRLKQIRVAQPEHGTTRIVLDLKENVEFRASQLAGPDRLMIELYDPSQSVPELTPSVSVSKRFRANGPVPATLAGTKRFTAPSPIRRPPQIAFLSEPPPPLANPRLPAMPKLLAAAASSRMLLPVPGRGPVVRRTKVTSRPEPPVTAASTDKLGSRSLTRMLGLKLNRIVIDAGHGGKDGGTIGVTGLLEKDVVLDLALRLGALVEKKLGAEVIFTRSDDNFIQLEERPEIANQRRADLFISIHANSSPAESVAGVETYILSLTPSSRSAEDLAARENATSDRSISELNEMVRKIALHDKLKESTELATQVNTSVATGVHGNARNRNRGVRRAPFIVLIGAQMPAVLVEVGFLSNAAEEARMRTPAHRQKVAESIFLGVRKYAESLSRVSPQLADRGTAGGTPGITQ